MTEEKVRKQWLTCFLVLLILPIFLLILMFLIELMGGLDEGGRRACREIFVYTIFSTPTMLATYLLAYKERGTLWLLILLINIIVFSGIEILRFILSGHVSETYMSIYVLVQSWYFVTTYRLYKINAVREYREYQKEIQG